MVEKITRLLRKDPPALVLAALASVIYLFYWSQTSMHDHAMDLRGHARYIFYISENLALPGPFDGWQFYHPPLYYIVAGLLHRLLVACGIEQPMEALRLLSLFFYACFLAYAYRSLRLLVPPRSVYFYTAWALLLFWPIGIVIASRIDGNVLFYPLFAAGFFHLLRWRRYRRMHDLCWALAVTGLALLTRSSGLILVVLIGGAVAQAVWRKKMPLSAFCTPVLAGCLVWVLAAGGFNFIRIVHARAEGGPLLVANFEKLGRDLRVENSPENFFWFDGSAFFHPPFYDVRRDETGRQYYWVGLLKSALYGEFTWGKRALARVLNGLWLAMLAYTAVAWVAFRRRAPPPGTVFAACALGFMLACSIAMRLLYPAASTQDFRYIYPALVPLAALFAGGCRRTPWPAVRKAGVALAAAFAMVAVAIIV